MSRIARLALPALVLLGGCSSVDDLDVSRSETDRDGVADNRSSGETTEDLTLDGAPDELAFSEADRPPLPDPIGGVDVVEADASSTLASVAVPLGGELSVDIPAGTESPQQPEYAYVYEAPGPDVVGPDGVAIVQYLMTTIDGTVVERSDEIAQPFEAVIGEPGSFPPTAFGVPSAFENSIIGRPIGSRLKIAFPAGMPGLPSYLDDSEAHVLVLDIVSFQAPVAS